MPIKTLEVFEETDKNWLDLGREKLEAFAESFKPAEKPEIVQVVAHRINDITGDRSRIYENTFGSKVRDVLSPEGKLIKRSETLGNHQVKTVHYDDAGNPYLVEQQQQRVNGNRSRTDIFIPKGIDSFSKDGINHMVNKFGQIDSCSIENPKIMNELARKDCPKARTLGRSNFGKNDVRGHVIAHRFGGPENNVNYVPMDADVNNGVYREMENFVAKKIEEGQAAGKKVEYSVKCKYSSLNSKRPSSFEPHLKIDGEEVPLDAKFQKIYNKNNPSEVHQVTTNLQEQFLDQHGEAHAAGLRQAKTSCLLSASISTVKNLSGLVKGEKNLVQAVTGIAGDTAKGGAIAYGTGFAIEKISATMAKSSVKLIKNVGNTSLPAHLVSFGVASYTSVADFAKREIDLPEFTKQMGGHVAEIAGSSGGAIAGAAAVAGAATVMGVAAVPAVIGTGGAIVGGLVGTALASNAYDYLTEEALPGAKEALDQAKTMANETIENIAAAVPEKLDQAKDGFNTFFKENNIPILIL